MNHHARMSPDRFPSAPAHRSTAAIEAAIPVQIVAVRAYKLHCIIDPQTSIYLSSRRVDIDLDVFGFVGAFQNSNCA